MACKYFTRKTKLLPPEIGSGSALPRGTSFPDCMLGRLNRTDSVVGEAPTCEKTPQQGPCWWWEENQAGLTDLKFKTSTVPKK